MLEFCLDNRDASFNVLERSIDLLVVDPSAADKRPSASKSKDLTHTRIRLLELELARMRHDGQALLGALSTLVAGGAGLASNASSVKKSKKSMPLGQHVASHYSSNVASATGLLGSVRGDGLDVEDEWMNVHDPMAVKREEEVRKLLANADSVFRGNELQRKVLSLTPEIYPATPTRHPPTPPNPQQKPIDTPISLGIKSAYVHIVTSMCSGIRTVCRK
jgi:hypothetical protein